MKGQVTDISGKLEELHNLLLSPNTIRVIKSGIMRWAEHVV